MTVAVPASVNPADWVIRYAAPPARTRPALFCDRDGTLIENVPYLNDPAQVRLIHGVRDALMAWRARGYAVVVVTNQSGVARGLCTRGQYLAVEARVRAMLGSDALDAVYACPWHPDGQPPFAGAHRWRKPGDGMLRAAATDLRLDLSRSVIAGDCLSDLRAGAAAGLHRLVHVLTGHGRAERDAVAAFGASGAAGRLVEAPTLAQVRPDIIGTGAA